jgi:ATP-dependent exoDNAse (exonuclease V) beta subunit
MIALIDDLKDELPSKINLLIEKLNVEHSEVDVTLTTVHQAKGLEYNHVKLLDDFIELTVTRKWIEGSSETNKHLPKTQFKLKSWGDDLNLW